MCVPRNTEQVSCIVAIGDKRVRFISRKKVYHHDTVAQKRDMSPDERLTFHQQNSGPLPAGLKDRMETKLRDKTIEPNSGMGKTFDCMLKRWDKLTRFTGTLK